MQIGIFLKVIGFLATRFLKVKIYGAWKVAHEFYVILKKRYNLVLEFIDQTWHQVANLNVQFEDLFSGEKVITAVTLFCGCGLYAFLTLANNSPI